jgi:hypothetical protein
MNGILHLHPSSQLSNPNAISENICQLWLIKALDVQVLDVLLFRRLKALETYLAKDNDEDRETDHVPGVFRIYEGVTIAMMIRGSWEKAGFTYQRRDRTMCLAVDEGRIRIGPDFCEISERGSPMGSLSARRRSQRRRWLDQRFFQVKYVRQLKEHDGVEISRI